MTEDERLTKALNDKTHFAPQAGGDGKSLDSMRVACPTCNLVLPKDTRFCPNDATPLQTSDTSRSIPNYQFIRVIGSGGMGHVYEAEHVVLKTRVAIKVLKPDLVETSAFARFQREAQFTSRLKHPNLIWAYDCGVSQNGEPYMVMDLVKGATLDSILKNGRMSIKESLEVVGQICQGMAYAHENGILHRDLKPSNIILAAEHGATTAKILDFGIAKIVEETEGTYFKTRTGEIFGTPAYMSPEQVSGTTLDQRSDVYAVGCILYEMLTGQPPVVGRTAMEVMFKHVNEAAVSLKQATMGENFPLALERIVARSLAKDPSNRFATMKEMSTAIDDYKSGKAIARVEPVSDKPKRNLLPIVGVALGLAVVIAIPIIAIYKIDEQKSSQASPSTNASTQTSTQAPESASKDSQSIFPESVMPAAQMQGGADSVLFQKEILNGSLTNIQVYPLVPDEVLALLAKNRNVESIDLTDCTLITVKGLHSIANLPNLRALNLTRTKLGDSAVPILNKIKHLEYLNLTGSDISDAGLKNLDGGLPLASLILAGTSIDGKGLSYIRHFKKLTNVSVGACELMDDAAVKQLEGLPLTSLDLSLTPVTNKVVGTILKMPLLKLLRLMQTDVEDKFLEAISTPGALPNLVRIDLRGCRSLSLKELKTFKQTRPNCLVQTDRQPSPKR